MATRILDSIGRETIALFEGVGRATILLFETCLWTIRPPYRFKQLLKSMEFVGVGSLFIVILTGVFTGAVFALQGAGAFRMFNAWRTLLRAPTCLTRGGRLLPNCASAKSAGGHQHF